MDEIAITVKDVDKSFVLPGEKHTSLKSAFIHFYKRRKYEEQQALKNISFEIKKGEFFGIVGRNGSGKSTLLKLISGIYSPTAGSVHINGTLVPFIELGVGFNMDLTGRENVYLNGALLGFSRKEMQRMYKDIVEFAELKRFMDQKLKNYSSGMQVRLAFSIAIRAQSDILLLDEVLAVGDAAFQQKCNDYFAGLKRKKQTIILVSHSMESVEKYCERALLLESSKIVKIGPSSEIAELYEEMILKEEAEKRAGGQNNEDGDVSVGVIDASVKILQKGKATKSVKAFDNFQIELTVESNKDILNASTGISIKNSEGQTLFAADTIDTIGGIEIKKAQPKKITLDLENVFTNGLYSVTLTVNDVDDMSSEAQLFKRRGIANFSISGVHKNSYSLVHPSFEISVA